MSRVRKLYFERAADVPNSTLPVLLYRAVLAPHTAAKANAFRQRFKAAGWTGLWTDTIYDHTHFHSNAHEVLGIAEGKVTLKLGGEEGSLFRLKAGDMLVLPAGVGHRRLGGDDGLQVIGAYPRGQSHYDMKSRGRAMPRVAMPSADPFYGMVGPLIQAWHIGRATHPVAFGT
jgi:uncharacterized protein YjlB